MSFDMVRDPLHPPLLKWRAAAARRRRTLGRIYRCGDVALHRNQDEHSIKGDSDGTLCQMT
jgi:hypothetical protein